ncbi:hypothetical protein PCANC_12559 [Puccinia coronata f. sp. avenae]|uniref:C2H2-type domain-containing protein n=1 Tax=Puccinia coronata f. sp. avenae TaxID=200324 RepID=A0A2N5SZN6_9BASI|nr:hypothetical protein PCANC_12559 [Puccinia coronata f. sp. avenae]
MEHHTVSYTSLPLPGNLSPSSRNRSTNWAIVLGLLSIITSLGFLEPSNLSKHMCIHLLVKKFQCTICGKHFTHSNQLSCHTKSRAIDSHNPLSAPHLPQDDDHQNHNNNKEEDRALQEKLGSQVPKLKHQKCMSCGPA